MAGRADDGGATSSRPVDRGVDHRVDRRAAWLGATSLSPPIAIRRGSRRAPSARSSRIRERRAMSTRRACLARSDRHARRRRLARCQRAPRRGRRRAFLARRSADGFHDVSPGLRGRPPRPRWTRARASARAFSAHVSHAAPSPTAALALALAPDARADDANAVPARPSPSRIRDGMATRPTRHRSRWWRSPSTTSPWATRRTSRRA